MARSSVSSCALGAAPARSGRERADAVGPRQKGRFLGRRAKKPKQLAIILDGCTGCAGAPVCQTTCPVEDCMLLIASDDALPFATIWVDPLRCVGCRKCVRDGPDETFLDGCPWDAIAMIATDEWERVHGELAY
jgi:ferredoxin